MASSSCDYRWLTWLFQRKIQFVAESGLARSGFDLPRIARPDIQVPMVHLAAATDCQIAFSDLLVFRSCRNDAPSLAAIEWRRRAGILVIHFETLKVCV